VLTIAKKRVGSSYNITNSTTADTPRLPTALQSATTMPTS
jgi:hypothetical protein